MVGPSTAVALIVKYYSPRECIMSLYAGDDEVPIYKTTRFSEESRVEGFMV